MLASVPLAKAGHMANFQVDVGRDSTNKAILWGMAHWGRKRRKRQMCSLPQAVIEGETLKLTFLKHNNYVPYNLNRF